MQWELIIALVIAIPIILFPAAYIWYINIGGIYALIKEVWERQVARGNGAKLNAGISQEQEYENALANAIKHYPWH
ncbi:hypothetical protein ACFLX3_04940 [Chloroflexota bacterium]